MEHWICTTCGTQFSHSAQPPSVCPICSDQRQYIGHKGQQWTTLAAMRAEGYHNTFRQHEERLTGIGTEPRFAIGQRALLLEGESGNVLWDCISLLDEATAAQIRRRGGLHAIAISHPHFYTTMVEWGRQFDAPIYLHEADRQWVMRPDERIRFWSGESTTLPGAITLVRLGGHFAGSTVLHWPHGAGGRGALLSGDTLQVVADRRWVSFMYSYPNLLPLPAAVVGAMRASIARYEFERLYGMLFESVVEEEAHQAVMRSAERYIQALLQRLD
jgi:glyoxylase-like metal-dependent hydrolase (beta-lactamase superfamily II)